MDKCCPVSGVVALTNGRVTGQCGLPSLDMCCSGCFCQVVHDGHVISVSGKVSCQICQLCPFLLLENALKITQWLSIVTGVYHTRSVLLHMCFTRSTLAYVSIHCFGGYGVAFFILASSCLPRSFVHLQ